MSRFEGQCVVVTGGASGIGEATVRAIVQEGGRVLIADLQEERGQALVSELGDMAAFHLTNVTQEDDIAAAIAQAQEVFGPLTGMVNNAGVVGAIGSIMETSAEDFDRTMAILSRAVFLGIKHAARAMQPQAKGAIVSLASTAGVIGGLGPHVYTMAKHGVVGITKSAASELARLGIRVNAVAPGGTVTPMTNALGDNNPESTAKMIAEGSPLGIACMPEDIARGILFLLSDDTRYMTGHTLVIDAGETTGAGQPSFFSSEADLLLHAGIRGSGS
ncbi:MAG: NAD(P)-dependent dehydrogenase (short-subunit alcohol dehydrogenase family) [Halioglobus sp.]|jgi:NAD(P)-dependent dehydrogenase (short-subunit alcohol dehydrogenase family)